MVLRLLAALLVLIVAAGVWWALDDSGPSPLPERDVGPEQDLPVDPDADVGSPGAPDETPVPEPGAGELLVVVRDARGAPAAGALVVLRPGGVETTDDRGHARLEAPGGRGTIRVALPSGVPHTIRSSLEPGTVRVDLPPGLSVEGRLVFRGYVPGEPVRLRLYSPVPLEAGKSAGQLACEVRADGRFRFFGLPEGWSGQLGLPSSCEILSPEVEGRRLPVSAPARDLEIIVRCFPVVTARVLLPGGERPAPMALVVIEYESERGAGRASFSVGGGRIRARMDWSRMTKAVAVVSNGGHDAVRIDFDLARLTRDHDLGTIVLRRERTVDLLVRDEGGAPIPEARVSPGGLRTDGKGRVTVRPAEGVDRLLVGKPGYRVVAVDPAGAGGEPVEVVLPAANLLEIRVRDPKGEAAGRVAVGLLADSRLFDSPGGGYEDDLIGTGVGRLRGSSWSDEGGRWTFRPDDEARVHVAGIRPRIAFRIEVRDALFDTLLAERTVTMGPAGRRVVTLEVPAATADFAGRVVDGDGKPIERARVWVGRSISLTDGEGRFRVEGIRRVSSVPILVEKDGYTPLAREDVPVSEEARFTMEKGRVVILRVWDPEDEPVRPETVFADEDRWNRLFPVNRRADGAYRVRNLPSGTVRLVAVRAGRPFAIEHDTSRGEAEIRVPATGSAVVRWSFALETPVLHRLRLEPVGEAGHEVSVEVEYVPDRTSHQVRVPAVLPGEYRVLLEVYGERAHRPFAEAPKVRVEAGGTAEVELAR